MLTLCSDMLALEMLSPIAVTETTERGGEGVGTARRPPARTRAVAVGRRPDLKADAWQPGAGRRGAMLALCWSPLDLWALCCPYVRRCQPYVGPSALCWRYVGLSSPMLTLCWPKGPLSCPHVDPMLAYVTPILPLCWPMLPYVGLSYPYLALSCPYLAPMSFGTRQAKNIVKYSVFVFSLSLSSILVFSLAAKTS